MGYKATDKCIEKAFEDERLFVLMARDATAPAVIFEWIKMNDNLQPREKLEEAFECAGHMSRQHDEIRARLDSPPDKGFKLIEGDIKDILDRSDSPTDATRKIMTYLKETLRIEPE